MAESGSSRQTPGRIYRASRTFLGGPGRLIKWFAVRAYALFIMLLVLATGYAAVAYLVDSVFRPTELPERFQHWGAALAVDDPAAAPPAARSPLAHYHGIRHWPHPERLDGCTTSGCHHPLPHSLRPEVRAFANLHSTFITCMTCHDRNITGTLDAEWVDARGGQPRPPPALLSLLALFEIEGEGVQDRPDEVHPRIFSLLSEALQVIGHDPVLDYLLVRLETSQVGSPAWRQGVAELAEEVPNHLRGEYGARIAPRGFRPEALDTPSEAVRRYLAAAEGSTERERLYQEIHADVLPDPNACLACHGEEPPRLDYEALGYPPRRAADLSRAPIVRLIQQIREGQPFHLPRLLEDGP
jgi:cytochrome c553